MVATKCDHSQNKTRLIDFLFFLSFSFFFSFSFFSTFAYDWSALGVDTRSRFRQASTQAKANPGFWWDFYQFDRCQPESGDSSLTAKIGLSLVGPILHTANELSTLYPIALDRSRLIVYSCPHRASLCLTHHPHPAFLQSLGNQGTASLFHWYHVLRNMVVRPLSRTDKNALQPHLQKG